MTFERFWRRRSATARALAAALFVLGTAAGATVPSAPAQAALITQTLNFVFSDSGSGVTNSSQLYDPISGTAVFTYDDAATSSIFGQAVDSISFSTPTGVFQTGDVYFDMRIASDLTSPTNNYELDIYYQTLGVYLNDTTDFLLRVASLLPRGDSFDTTTGSPVAGLFNYSDEAFTFYGENAAGLSSTSVAASGLPVAVPEPGMLVIFGAGMIGLSFGFRRRG